MMHDCWVDFVSGFKAGPRLFFAPLFYAYKCTRTTIFRFLNRYR